MNKAGFSLIEIMIALVLCSILIGFVMSTLRLVQRGVTTAQPLVEQIESVAVLYDRLTTDIQGMCIPLSAQESQTSNNLEKICWSSTQQDQCDFITFISNNPLEFYADTLSTCPHLVRIAYFLKKDGDGTYSLYRAQSNNLTDGSMQHMSKNAYKIIQGIQAMSVMFYASYYKNNNDEKKSLYESNVWQYDEWIKKNKSLTLAKIPQWVRFSITFKHSASHLTQPVVIDSQVLVYDVQKQTEHKKTDSQTAQQQIKPLSEMQKAVQELQKMQKKGS